MGKRSLNLTRPVSTHPSNQGLIGWWLALPGMVGGPKYWDISQYRNHATLQSFAPPSGPGNVVDGSNTKFGAIKCDGVDTHGAEASVANIPTLNLGNPLTISLWLQNVAGENAQCLSVCNSGYAGIGIRTRTPQNNVNGGPLVYGSNPPPSSSSAGKWHLVYTQDSVNNNLYVNGNLWQSDPAASGYTRSTVNFSRLWFAKNTYLGGSEGLASGDLLGDVQILNRAASKAEVALRYQQRLRGYPDLLAYRSWVSFAKTAGGGTNSVSVSDAATGTESVSITVSFTATDTGTGTNALTTTAAFTVTDTGSGADSASLAASISASDTGTGTNAITSTSTAFTVTDAATGVDAWSVAASISTSDTGAGADGSSVSGSGTVNVSDTGTGVDLAVVSAALTVTDIATGTEGTPGIGFTTSDTGTGTNAVALAVAFTVADTATGVEAITLSAAISRGDSGTGADSAGTGTFTPISVSDSGIGVEAVTISVTLNVSDTATGIEVTTINAAFTVTDTGVGLNAVSVNTGSLNFDVFLFFLHV